ncbi:uncharacterized protein LOC110432717 [Sorghum bicolor]|uniref:uncharacterized protein LOC110432717 n=1 Tax=Sorghum bicolor TaxID=4558 RepID=UPI000B425E19|nr:uncharacterized protein LOC110432717 [Sorghum bicolor]|eukprot:XP_021309182.1 uncharacterized protein LOC110432717 [Sorghum bicolor]
MDLKIVGPGCTALHAHYMKDCADNEKSGILVRFKGIYMLNSSDFEVGLVRSLFVEAKAKDIPVGFLDPQLMSLDSIKFDRAAVLQYVQKAFTKYTGKDFIMFAYNSGGHWVVLIVIQKWNKVIYLDSNKSGNHDFSMLKLLIDEAFATHTSKMKDKPKPLTHAAKYACHQQSISGKGSSFYAAHL